MFLGHWYRPVARRRSGGLDEDALRQPLGPKGAYFADDTMLGLITHVNREAIHHGAEVCLLRDLYRAGGGSRSQHGVGAVTVTAFDLHIVFDCADPDRVARFWMAALGGYDFPFGVPDGLRDLGRVGRRQRHPGGSAQRRPHPRRQGPGTRPDIFFLQVPESKPVKNRVHLDIKVAPGSTGRPAYEDRVRGRTPDRPRRHRGHPDGRTRTAST